MIVGPVTTATGAVLLVLGLSSPAYADAWATFEQHCLTPLVATTDPITPAFAPVHDDADSARYLWVAGDVTVTITRHKDAGFQPVTCAVHADSPTAWAEIAKGHAAWSDQVLQDDSFQTLDEDEGLFSTFQREPLVRVFLVRPDQSDRPFVAIEETRLES